MDMEHGEFDKQMPDSKQIRKYLIWLGALLACMFVYTQLFMDKPKAHSKMEVKVMLGKIDKVITVSTDNTYKLVQLAKEVNEPAINAKLKRYLINGEAITHEHYKEIFDALHLAKDKQVEDKKIEEIRNFALN